jgi:hypothetical protein
MITTLAAYMLAPRTPTGQARKGMGPGCVGDEICLISWKFPHSSFCGCCAMSDDVLNCRLWRSFACLNTQVGADSLGDRLLYAHSPICLTYGY